MLHRLRQNIKSKKPYRQQCGDGQRERLEVSGGGKRGRMGTEKDFAWGGGHLLQCDDVLLCCTLEACMVL